MSGMPKHTGACSGALLANGLFEELTSPIKNGRWR
ncbi:hypothetical protein OROGR_030720 [Orobanche gracilis]